MLTNYADDISVIVYGKCLATFGHLANQALTIINNRAILKDNADKKDLVIFTRKYKILIWIKPELRETTLQLEPSTKYLRIVLDSKLSWRLNASAALYA